MAKNPHLDEKEQQELAELAHRATRAAIALGIEPGDRVAVWAPNGHEWIAAALGITEQAARARVARALKALRGAMRDRPLGEEGCR